TTVTIAMAAAAIDQGRRQREVAWRSSTSRRADRIAASAIATASMGRIASSAIHRAARSRRASNRKSDIVDLLAEPCDEACQATPHAARGHADGLTDLRRVEAGDVAERDECSIFRRQSPDCGDELVVGRSPGRITFIGSKIGELDRDHSVAPSPPDQLTGLVRGDADEPRPKPLGGTQGAGPP